MAHGIRCGTAKTDKKFCKCECKGNKHGNQAGLDEFMNDEFERAINESFGGEVENYINSIKNQEFFCMCGKILIAKNFIAHPHEGGLIDAEGYTWWLHIHCPFCNYDIAYWKVKNRVDTMKRQKKNLKKLEKKK